MGAIEGKIIECFNAEKPAKLSIRDVVEVDGGKVKVLLWQNNIFERDTRENDFYFSFCGWSTQTTKSRINALLRACNLGGIRQKNYKMLWSLGGSETVIDTDKKYKVVEQGDGLGIVEV